MGEESKVSKEDYKTQTENLYAKIGKISVLSEHLNFAMGQCADQILRVKGLSPEYSQAVLVGHNLENMRRTWEMLMKVYFAADADAMGMIDHVSHRIDNVVRRRNDTIHRLWFIGWGNEETETYEVAGSMKAVRNIGKNSLGGVRYTDRSTEDFDEIIGEIEKLTAIVRRFLGCVVMPVFDRNRGKPTANFHYDSSGKLVDAPPPAKK